MRVKLKRMLCLLCVLTLLFTSTGVLSTLALDEADISESEAEIFHPEEDAVLFEGEDGESAYDPGSGKEQSGLFVMTGLEEPTGEPEDYLGPSVLGNDVKASADVARDSGAAPDAPGTAELKDGGSSVMTPTATPTVKVSTTQVSLKVGETVSVTVQISGYPSGAYLQAVNSNSKAFSAIWGDWSKSSDLPSIPIRLTGKGSGGGTLTIHLKDTSNQSLASATVNVTVVADKPTLSVSPTSVSMNVGASATSKLTVSNYSGGGSISASIGNNSICSVKWGSWSGWTIPVTITGKSSGNTKITIRLYNSSKTELASVTLNVEVTASASLTVSPSSLSVNTGESTVLTATANGSLSNGYSFKYSISNSNLCSITQSSTGSTNTLRLLVAGKNAGSGTLTVSLYSKAGQVLATKTVSIKVNQKSGGNSTASVSPSSVTVKVGESVKVNCMGNNVSGSYSMKYVYVDNSSSLFTAAWKDKWSGNTVPVTITGKKAGTGSLNIQLLVSGVVKSTATIKVTVSGTTPDPTPIGQSPSYSFGNYSKPGISLALCQYMFGKGQKAKTVYNYDIGNGGVCFGVSSTAGLLSSPNSPLPSVFGKSSMTALKKSDYCSSWGLSLSDFIECMHITQVSTTIKHQSGISSMLSAVRSGGTSQPVIVCVYGPGGGHAILGYGVEGNNIIVYDPNWPGQVRKVITNGSSTWSYELWSGTVWSNSNGRITYIPYSNYTQAWQNRGSLKGAILQDGGLLNEEDPTRYLLATTADDFTLLAFDGTQMAVYENGQLKSHDPAVDEAFVGGVPLYSEEQTHVHMLYVPEDLYTIQNPTGKEMKVTLSGNGLSVEVKSEAQEFDIAVSDEENFASALLNDVKEGEPYSISVGASDSEENKIQDATTIEGTGNGQPICLGFGIGGTELSMEGLYISNGTDALALNAMEDENGQEDRPFKQDFALNSTSYDTEYPLTAEVGEGGKILPREDSPTLQDGEPPKDEPYDPHRSIDSVLEGGNHTYRIQPENGYTLKAIYINGVEAAYSDAETDQPSYSYYDGAYEYTFRDVNKPGYLFAEFTKDINTCQVNVENGGENLVVTVTDGDKVLVQETDYTWSVSRVEEDGQQKTYVTVQALSESDYSGTSMTPIDFKDISTCQVNVENGGENLVVTVTDGDKVLVQETDYTWSVSRVEEDGQQKTYVTVQGVSGGPYFGTSNLKDINACLVKGDYDGGTLVVTVTDGDKTLTQGTDYTYTTSQEVEAGEQKNYIVVQGVPGGTYFGTSKTPFDYHPVEDTPSLENGTYNATDKTISLTVKNAQNPKVIAAAYKPTDGKIGQMITFLDNATLSEKTTDGTPVKISLGAVAGLPETEYIVRVFLVNDMMCALCVPIDVPVSSGGVASSEVSTPT